MWLDNLKRRDYWEDLGVDWKIILKWITDKQNGKMWIGSIWLRIGTKFRLIQTRQRTFRFYKMLGMS
jgi:hypothetical protein